MRQNQMFYYKYIKITALEAINIRDKDEYIYIKPI